MNEEIEYRMLREVKNTKNSLRLSNNRNGS